MEVCDEKYRRWVILRVGPGSLAYKNHMDVERAKPCNGFRSKMGVHDMCSGSPLVLNCMLPPSPKLFYIFLMDFGWLPSDYYLTTINLQPKPSFRSKFRTKISNETFEISFKTTFSFTALRLLLIVRVGWLCGTSQLTPHI